MTATSSYDPGEIGRGRRRSGNDSTSSRESSTERSATNRIASPPASEDGNEDSRMDAVANDDTPPPPSRPLIRQALGFSSDQPLPSINTYEAVPEPVPKQGFFLPGQEVPTPPAPPKPEKTAKKTKRRGRTEAYPGQTSRFRIQTYDPTPSADPPVDHGSGPYLSMYRGVAMPPKNTADSPSLPSTGGPGTSTAPSNTIGPPPRAKAPAQRRPAVNRIQTASSSSVPPKNRSQPAKSVQMQSNPNSNNQHMPSHSPGPSSTFHHPHPGLNAGNGSSSGYRGPSPGPSGGGSYYRQEYYSPPRDSQYRDRERDHGQHSGSSAAAYNGTMHLSDNHAQKRNKGQPLRMVTLLIQDLRSGTVDHQLAEVKVPLRQGEVPEDGFWADAQDIARELQSGPSRIDGPARAYTLRGKYRQFLLRVSARNVDEFLSANVVIEPDRTLNLVVEMLPAYGAPPPAPRIPPDLLGPNYDYEGQAQATNMDVDSRGPHDRRTHEKLQDSRKRMNSPSFDDYDNPSPGPQSHPVPNKAPRHSYSHQHSRGHTPQYTGQNAASESSTLSQRSRSTTADLSRAQYTFPGPTSMTPPRPPRSPPSKSGSLHPIELDDSDDSMSPNSEIEEAFAAQVDRVLQEDPTWIDFFKAKAGNKVADVIREYEFVWRKCNELRGTTVPGFTQHITDQHIIESLKIDEPNYLQNCHKTMHLYSLYGKQGRNYEDPRVIEMMNDTTPPKAGSNLYKRILHLLQELDEHWHNGKTDPSRQQPQQQTQDPVPSASDNNRPDPVRQGSRNSKGMFA